jgi:hypothetical protein
MNRPMYALNIGDLGPVGDTVFERTLESAQYASPGQAVCAILQGPIIELDWCYGDERDVVGFWEILATKASDTHLQTLRISRRIMRDSDAEEEAMIAAIPQIVHLRELYVTSWRLNHSRRSRKLLEGLRRNGSLTQVVVYNDRWTHRDRRLLIAIRERNQKIPQLLNRPQRLGDEDNPAVMLLPSFFLGAQQAQQMAGHFMLMGLIGLDEVQYECC